MGLVGKDVFMTGRRRHGNSNYECDEVHIVFGASAIVTAY